jgi:hypothetical protein
LLDRLLTAGSSRSPDLAAAFARQPALLVAAEEAAQATDRGEAVTVPEDDAAAITVRSGSAAAASPGPDANTPRRPRTAPRAKPVPPPPDRPSGGRWSRIVVAVVALAALATSLTVAGVVYGVIPVSDRGAPNPSPTANPLPAVSSANPLPTVTTPTPTPTPTATPTPTPSASVGADGQEVLIADPLNVEGVWPERNDKANHTTCAIEGALVVTRETLGSYRCPGLQDVLTDFSVSVDVKLRTPGSCAAVWFRFDTAGFVLRVCAEAYYLATHGVGGPAAVTPLRTFPLADPIALGIATRVSVTAKGTNLTFARDGQHLGDWTQARFQRGRVVLGIFQDSQTKSPPPFAVSFANIEIRTLAN